MGLTRARPRTAFATGDWAGKWQWVVEAAREVGVAFRIATRFDALSAESPGRKSNIPRNACESARD